MDEKTIAQQLEELQLIKCSLLPNEIMHFIDDDNHSIWAHLLDDYEMSVGSNEAISQRAARKIRPAEFLIKLDGQTKVWLEVKMPDVRGESSRDALVSVKGDRLSRAEQERWRCVIREKQREIAKDAEYPHYELLSLHLLPLLQQNEQEYLQSLEKDDPGGQEPRINTEITMQKYHVLFTSHHLVSPHKRRLLQEWSSSLRLSGFAKVGYPGVIYAQGERELVEEFAANVKSMQWLALRMRFVEPVDEVEDGSGNDGTIGKGSWKEFQKLGEVVEEMRRLGRERCVIDMGIGNAQGRDKV
ncbi:hypothetical protein F5887DRAFT_894449 [Amanita rubescens]|nr:hypothetical protein F5887DRAFT_894449 [Amanita rubescens]